MRKNRKQEKFLLKAICVLSFTIIVSGCSWNQGNVDKNQEDVWENASLTLDSNNGSKEETNFDTGIQQSEMIDASETADTIEGKPIVENSSNDTMIEEPSLDESVYEQLRNKVVDIFNFYGGSYIDEEGKSVVLLTEDSEENRKALCLSLGISESNTIFQTVTYPMFHVKHLVETIEQANLPFVTSVTFYETLNKVEVRVVTDEEDDLAKLYELDTLGDAIVVKLDKEKMWSLVLVNPWNSLPKGFSVDLVNIGNGHSIDKRAYADLQQMLKDAKKAGMSMFVCSSYRTNAKQTTLYNNKVQYYRNQGYSKARAQEKAGAWVARPGTSEHQLGLALDIVSTSYTNLDKKQERTKEQKWLMANSYKYGFILRYPSDKCDITGINYEPWHYRYVGKAAAKEIYEKGICLEEYLLY